ARADGHGGPPHPTQACGEVLAERGVRPEALDDDALRAGKETERPREVGATQRLASVLQQLHLGRENVLEDDRRIVTEVFDAAAQPQGRRRPRAKRFLKLGLERREAAVSQRLDRAYDGRIARVELARDVRGGEEDRLL